MRSVPSGVRLTSGWNLRAIRRYAASTAPVSAVDTPRIRLARSSFIAGPQPSRPGRTGHGQRPGRAQRPAGSEDDVEAAALVPRGLEAHLDLLHVGRRRARQELAEQGIELLA